MRLDHSLALDFRLAATSEAFHRQYDAEARHVHVLAASASDGSLESDFVLSADGFFMNDFL